MMLWPFLQNWGEGPLRCCKLQGVFQNDEGGITLQQKYGVFLQQALALRDELE